VQGILYLWILARAGVGLGRLTLLLKGLLFNRKLLIQIGTTDLFVRHSRSAKLTDMGRLIQPPIDFEVLPEPEQVAQPLRARRDDPETAHDAADDANENFPSVSESILNALRAIEPEGLTTEELSELTHIHLKSVSPSMKPMEKANLVHRVEVGVTSKGKKSYRKRKNLSGKSAIIWYAVKGV
jgi:hypothetical protein